MGKILRWENPQLLHKKLLVKPKLKGKLANFPGDLDSMHKKGVRQQQGGQNDNQLEKGRWWRLNKECVEADKVWIQTKCTYNFPPTYIKIPSATLHSSHLPTFTATDQDFRGSQKAVAEFCLVPDRSTSWAKTRFYRSIRAKRPQITHGPQWDILGIALAVPVLSAPPWPLSTTQRIARVSSEPAQSQRQHSTSH